MCPRGAGTPAIPRCRWAYLIHGVAGARRRGDHALSNFLARSLMDTPQNPGNNPAMQGAPAAVDQEAAWHALLSEMTELHARLEYLRVMLKIGVRNF